MAAGDNGTTSREATWSQVCVMLRCYPAGSTQLAPTFWKFWEDLCFRVESVDDGPWKDLQAGKVGDDSTDSFREDWCK